MNCYTIENQIYMVMSHLGFRVLCYKQITKLSLVKRLTKVISSVICLVLQTNVFLTQQLVKLKLFTILKLTAIPIPNKHDQIGFITMKLSVIHLMFLPLTVQVLRESSMWFFMRRKMKHVLQGLAYQQH